jgi:hypothetical protein
MSSGTMGNHKLSVDTTLDTFSLYRTFKGIVSRDYESVLLIPVFGWDVSIEPLEGLKFLKCCFPLNFFYNNN